MLPASFSRYNCHANLFTVLPQLLKKSGMLCALAKRRRVIWPSLLQVPSSKVKMTLALTYTWATDDGFGSLSSWILLLYEKVRLGY